MKSKCKLGDIISQRREKYNGENLPICGVTRDGFIPPKQKDADLSLYNVFYKDDFVFNPARMELNAIVFNDIYEKAICSSLYEIFYVSKPDIVLPSFLALLVKQAWFTRYCEFLGSGSAREYCRVVTLTAKTFLWGRLRSSSPVSIVRSSMFSFQMNWKQGLWRRLRE